jgi:amino acid transporter
MGIGGIGNGATPPGAGPDDGDRDAEAPTLGSRLRRIVVGKPRNLGDPGLHKSLALIPLLAWVGLGADGLSSSCYGPAEAFKVLLEGDRAYLALVLAAATAFTVCLISLAYARIIEDFPTGGGGYLVAAKLLGPRAGVVSGCALLVDYILTITVSVAAAGDAIFSFLPADLQGTKMMVEVFFILGLVALNARGVRESVTFLAPIFVLFLLTHAVVILGGVFSHAGRMPQILGDFRQDLSLDLSSPAIGFAGVLGAFLYAYSLGGGTYTGIEAVSNGLPIMREPRVKTAHRTMLYMALSLALAAGGLLLCYLLWDVREQEHQTLNAVLFRGISKEFGLGTWFVGLTLATEGALCIVAAQAGVLAGPRILANMSIDSWVPNRFAALSERLTTLNGILLMGAASLGALLYTGGETGTLVIMYSINVFLTFALSMLGMLVDAVRHSDRSRRRERLVLFGTALVASVTILVITVYEKFTEGGWITLVATGTVVVLCFLVRAHYLGVRRRLRTLYQVLEEPPADPTATPPGAPDPKAPTAAILVSSYGGVGVHTALTVLNTFPGQFKNLAFLSVGVIDSGTFKGEGSLEALQKKTEHDLKRYEEMARKIGYPSFSRYALGTDTVAEAEKLCLEVAGEFPRATFFAGKVIFQRETFLQRILHNQTAEAIQRRLHWAGRTMVILPARAV